MPERDITVLGIHDGHNSSAALLKDGRIIAAVSEERLSRLKNDPGYPKRAIEKALELGNCSPDDIGIVALGTRFIHPREFFLDWEWYKRGYGHQLRDSRSSQERGQYFLNERLRDRKESITKHLGISLDKVAVIEHHQAHAATAYYGSQWAVTDDKVLILTLDGSGDGICATVNIGENGKITRLAQTKSDASLGKIYSRITYLLGMKPWEHEYKIMGLAPYADDSGVAKSYEILKELVDVEENGLVFRRKTRLSTNYCYPYLRRRLENHRFDWVAGAVQKLQEELVIKWVKNAIAKTGGRKVACAGGSFMNVKTNMRILELEEVNNLFMFPSCGDESISIGAAYQAYADYLQQNGDEVRITPVKSIYLGSQFSQEEIEAYINAAGISKKYHVEFKENINDTIAALLASGEIVARFDGRMEWGARTLGNRSILADPRNTEKVKELNIAIKQRDFWMPFAPTILYERQHEYLLNPKEVKAPYMILAFPTTGRAHMDLAAAIHPYDFTVRPQILERETNPSYYDLIKHFEAITGVGGVLNTSFNLHGEPIVCTPKDAITTFKNSGLNYLALGKFLISK